MKFFDCFSFFNELELLDLRLHHLWDDVDYFVIVEGDHTYSGKKKDSYYLQNKEKFAWAEEKIIHVIATLEENPASRWHNEAAQRNAFLQDLGDIEPEDLVGISCIDEIFNEKVLQDLRKSKVNTPVILVLQNHYYYFNGRTIGSRRFFPCPVIGKYGDMSNGAHAFWEARFGYGCMEGGWHFSFLGGEEKIIEKIESFSHSEYDNESIKSPERIKDLIDAGKDIFDRGDQFRFTYVPVDETFPEYLQENQDKYSHLIHAVDTDWNDVDRLLDESRESEKALFEQNMELLRIIESLRNERKNLYEIKDSKDKKIKELNEAIAFFQKKIKSLEKSE